jgi:CheY-like chemotaxis protein
VARILIAEDEEPLRRLVMRALAQAGHEVVEAADGAEALELLGREGDRFDLLLSDIRMPLLDGVALAFAAARDHPALAIVLMTAYAEQRERIGKFEARIHDIIAKPFTLAEIRVAVADALAARDAG